MIDPLSSSGPWSGGPAEIEDTLSATPTLTFL